MALACPPWLHPDYSRIRLIIRVGKFLSICEVAVTVSVALGGGVPHLLPGGEIVSQPIVNESPSGRRSLRNRPWLARPDGHDRIYVYLASASSQSLGQAVKYLVGPEANKWSITYVNQRRDREVWLLERDQT